MPKTKNKHEVPSPSLAGLVPLQILAQKPRHAVAYLLNMAGHYLRLAHKLFRARSDNRVVVPSKRAPAGWLTDMFGLWEPEDTPAGNLEKGGHLAFAAASILLCRRVKKRNIPQTLDFADHAEKPGGAPSVPSGPAARRKRAASPL